MDERARQAYLQTQVMNATPQRMQWMLIDGALRYANQAETAWEEDDRQRASESLDRCRQIIAEILSSIRPNGDEITRSVMVLYLWLFRAVAEAQLKRDKAGLTEVIRVLKIERETWRQLCEQMQGEAGEQASAQHVVPPLSLEAGSLGETSGISFEA